jgi:hypothetical protein
MENCTAFGGRCTVKVNGKARHPEWMAQVQNIRVLKKVFSIPDKNFTTNKEICLKEMHVTVPLFSGRFGTLNIRKY